MDSSGTFVFDMFEEMDLYDLAKTAQNEDYKRLSEWLCNYQVRKIAEHNRLWERDKRREYEHEYQFLLKLIDSYITFNSRDRKKRGKGFLEMRRMRRRILALSREIFGGLPLSPESRLALDRFLKKREFGPAFRSFVQDCFSLNPGDGRVEESVSNSDHESATFRESEALREFIDKKIVIKDKGTVVRTWIDPDEYLDLYEKKLQNHIFLLDELVEILNHEYDRRIISTKYRFEEYLRPQKRVLEKIDEEIREIGEDLAYLVSDESLDETDREKLMTAFTVKQEELASLKKQEYEKLCSIKLVSENIREGVGQFHSLLDNLKKRLRYFKKREFYVEKLSRYGADIPRFKSILDELYATFNQRIKSLQKSFLLFDLSFQKTVLDAIDDQSVINRIILSPHGTVDAELAIEMRPEKLVTPDQPDFSIVKTIEQDLSCLTPYEEGSA